MNRRKLLRNISIAGSVGLAGCIDRFNTMNSEDFNSEQQLNINIIEVAQNPTLSQHELNFDVEIEKEKANEEGPPQISITVENLQDNELILTGKTRRVFGGETSESPGVVLLQENEWSNEQIENDNCYRLFQDIPRSGTQYETSLIGNSEENIILDVLGSPASNDCIPIGEYRFETDYELLVPDEQTGQYKMDEFNWGFILEMYLNEY